MDGEESEAGPVLGYDQMKRYIVISKMTPRGPEYRIYDQLIGCTIEGDWGTQKWAERQAELMEERYEQDKNGLGHSKVDSRQGTE